MSNYVMGLRNESNPHGYNAPMSVRAAGLHVASSELGGAVEGGVTPGAVAMVVHHGRTVLHEATGWAELEPTKRPMRLDTVFDLASLTKPLAATPVLLHLIERGDMALDAPISAYLPELRHRPIGAASVESLMTHTSGIVEHFRLYTRARTRD